MKFGFHNYPYETQTPPNDRVAAQRPLYPLPAPCTYLNPLPLHPRSQTFIQSANTRLAYQSALNTLKAK